MLLGGFVTKFENLPAREYKGKPSLGLSVVEIEGLTVLMNPEMANGGFRLGSNVNLHVRVAWKRKGPNNDIVVPQFWLQGYGSAYVPEDVVP